MSTAEELLTPELMKKARDMAAAVDVEDPTLAAGSQSEAEGRVEGRVRVADEDAGRVAGVDESADESAGAAAVAAAPLSPKQKAIDEATEELKKLEERDPPATQDELKAARDKLTAANEMEGGRRRRSRRRSGKKSAKKSAKKSKKGSARKSKKGGRSRKNGSKRRAHRKH